MFASQGAPPVSMTPVANLPPVSTTPAAKLPPVSTTPVANLPPPVLRIRDVYPGSRIRLFSIPDPGSWIPDPWSQIRTASIPDPGSSSKNLSILTPKKAKKWFLSSKKYDPGCSSRIPDPDADFLPSRIPDPGVKKAPNPGSRIRIRNTGINDTGSKFATDTGGK